ncbi:MAG: hypothetical protein JOZ82_07495 [Marmoricola sp.]|nr:hypothetical protein [Marmoricola sp.]
MSDQKPEGGDRQDGTTDSDGEGISDEMLPQDVRPDEDNPLARHPEQTGDEDDQIGADREGDPETAPLSSDDADYSDSSDGDSTKDSSDD